MLPNRSSLRSMKRSKNCRPRTSPSSPKDTEHHRRCLQTQVGNPHSEEASMFAQPASSARTAGTQSSEDQERSVLRVRGLVFPRTLMAAAHINELKERVRHDRVISKIDPDLTGTKTPNTRQVREPKTRSERFRRSRKS